MKKVNGCTKLTGFVSLGQEHEDTNSLCLKGIVYDNLMHSIKHRGLAKHI